jgi:hypothetical protein
MESETFAQTQRQNSTQDGERGGRRFGNSLDKAAGEIRDRGVIDLKIVHGKFAGDTAIVTAADVRLLAYHRSPVPPWFLPA